MENAAATRRSLLRRLLITWMLCASAPAACTSGVATGVQCSGSTCTANEACVLTPGGVDAGPGAPAPQPRCRPLASDCTGATSPADCQCRAADCVLERVEGDVIRCQCP